MLIFSLLCSISLLVSLGFKYNFLKDERILLYVILATTFFSLLPAANIPYMIDDVDHIYQLANASSQSDIFKWLLAPHNEHVMPLIKSLYLLFYSIFGFNAFAFHIAVFLIYLGITAFVYLLISCIFHSRPAGLIAASLWTATNLCDKAVFVITDSHILFCLLLFLVLFFLQYRYVANPKKILKILIFICIVLLPSTFSLGITSILFAYLFYLLCLPKEPKKSPGNLAFIITTAWLLSLIPYTLSASSIIHLPHYRDIGANSIFETIHVIKGSFYFDQYITTYLIPQFLLDQSWLSLTLFFSVVVAGLYLRKDIQCYQKQIGFFLIFGITLNLLIYMIRISWGTTYLGVSRYNVFPALTLIIIYSVVIHIFFLKVLIPKNANFKFIMYLFCLMLVSFGNAFRYNQAHVLSYETNQTVQKFYNDFSESINQYLKGLSEKKLVLKNVYITLPFLNSLRFNDGHFIDTTRYSRTTQFYINFLLGKELKNQVTCANTTDLSFIHYLESNEKYNYLAGLLK